MCQVSSTETTETVPAEQSSAEHRRFVVALRGAGHTATSQRLAVARALCETRGHVCVEHILAWVREHHPHLQMNKTTVYRALDLFLHLGLVREIRYGGERAQYELTSRGNHIHLVCSICGGLLELDCDVAMELRREAQLRQGFVIDLRTVPLYGICAACRR